MIGMDFGIKPKFMVVGDYTFRDYLTSSLEALLYSRLDHFNVISEPPLLGFIFADKPSATACFEVFKAWVDGSNDGDAVGIGFIKFNNGEYGLCVYPEQSRLVNRALPDELQEEVDVLALALGYLKIFPRQSEHFQWFENAVASSPFVVAPGTADEALMDYAFRKLNVEFYDEDEVPEHSIEGGLLRSMYSEGEGGIERPLPNIDKLEISEQRIRQLDRFFPVTQLRLRNNPDFNSTENILSNKGFAKWQILQAACNIVFQDRFDKSSEESEERIDANEDVEEDLDASVMTLLEYLIYNFEDVSIRIPEGINLSEEIIRNQITLDTKYLLDNVEERIEDQEVIDSTTLQEKLVHSGLI